MLRSSASPGTLLRSVVWRNLAAHGSGTGFSAELQMDDLGLITAYPGGWERAGQV